jgi:hypothetical protein
MSMAQTRATSKVIATKFRFVAVLGGFAKTPAEEMTGRERPAADTQQSAQQTAPAGATGSRQAQEVISPSPAQTEQHAPPQQQQTGNGEVVITERQGKMLFAIQRSVGINDEECKARLAAIGYTGHRDHIPKKMFNRALDAIDPQFRFHTKEQREIVNGD